MSKKCMPLWREAHFEVNMYKHHMFAPLLDVQMSFRAAGTRDSPPCQKWAKREDFVAVPTTMAGVGHLKRTCKDAFRVAGAVQKTCSSEMLAGQDADFLRGVAFWSIRSSGLLRWFCLRGVTFSWQAQYFRQMEWKNRKGRQLGTQLSRFEGSLAELLRFWCWQLRGLRKSRRLVSFLTLSSSFWGSLAE